ASFLFDLGGDKSREAIQMYRKAVETEPKNTETRAQLAWKLVIAPDETARNPKEAAELIQTAIDADPKTGSYWRTLGVAEYRNNDWQKAVKSLRQSMALQKGGNASDWMFLAMAQWQLGEKRDARDRYDQAVKWIEQNDPKNADLLRFHAEAGSLLGVV